MKTNYYMIIPEIVVINNFISNGAKLLYGKILTTLNAENFSEETNEYFANFFKVEKRSVQNWLKELTDNNFIIVNIENNSERKIFVKYK